MYPYMGIIAFLLIFETLCQSCDVPLPALGGVMQGGVVHVVLVFRRCKSCDIIDGISHVLFLIRCLLGQRGKPCVFPHSRHGRWPLIRIR